MTAALSADQQLDWPGWEGGTLDPDRRDIDILLEPYGGAAEMPNYLDRTSEKHLDMGKKYSMTRFQMGKVIFHHISC